MAPALVGRVPCSRNLFLGPLLPFAFTSSSLPLGALLRAPIRVPARLVDPGLPLGRYFDGALRCSVSKIFWDGNKKTSETKTLGSVGEADPWTGFTVFEKEVTRSSHRSGLTQTRMPAHCQLILYTVALILRRKTLSKAGGQILQ